MSTDTEDKHLQANIKNVVADEEYSSGRRRFLFKGAVISAPVIMTVASRPVWAGGWRKWGGGKGRNCTLSGQLSGNLSTPDEVCSGEGCTPGYWKQDQHLDTRSGRSRPNSFRMTSTISSVASGPAAIEIICRRLWPERLSWINAAGSGQAGGSEYKSD